MFEIMKEKNPPAGGEKKDELKSFIAEIAEMKRKNREKGTPAHLFKVNPEELTPEDLGAWEKIKNETIQREDVEAYKKSLLNEKNNPKEGVSESRYEFLNFIRNRAASIFIDRENKKEGLV